VQVLLEDTLERRHLTLVIPVNNGKKVDPAENPHGVYFF
jgi:hypothetical protein